MIFCLSSGILPSNKTTYSLSQIQTALRAQTGAIPYLGCGHNGTVLQEVWYFSHVLGSVCSPLYLRGSECLRSTTGTIRALQKCGLNHQVELFGYSWYPLL